jgi:hypothetical protein
MTVTDGASAQYTLAIQEGQRAFYARVCVQIRSARPDEPDSAVTVGADVDAQWHDAVRFGVCYALEQASRESRHVSSSRPRVSVTEVDWQPFDSTAMTVFFATVQATWKGLGFTPQQPPRLDPSSAEYVIPS